MTSKPRTSSTTTLHLGSDVTKTRIEYAVASTHPTREGVHIGRPLPTRDAAVDSGVRLERINGSTWWIVFRIVTTRTVTSEWR